MLKYSHFSALAALSAGFIEQCNGSCSFSCNMMYGGQSLLVGFCGDCDEHLGCVKVGYVLTDELIV
jgi:hypothetical protein